MLLLVADAAFISVRHCRVQTLEGFWVLIVWRGFDVKLWGVLKCNELFLHNKRDRFLEKSKLNCNPSVVSYMWYMLIGVSLEAGWL